MQAKNDTQVNQQEGEEIRKASTVSCTRDAVFSSLVNDNVEEMVDCTGSTSMQ
jgi:hypothetical protein